MNNFEIVILALALVFSSWNSYLNAGLILLKEKVARKLYFAGIMFLMQFILAGTGVWLGYKLGSPEVRVNILISLSIMLIFGLKVLLSAIRSQTQVKEEEEEETDYTDNKVIFIAALTEGITPLFIGAAIGLLSTHPYLHWLLIGLFLISGIFSGQFLAARMGIKSLKFRFGAFGGLLLLAAAIKLALNIIRF
jgi:putative Mn2+ efflux pump MntP